MSTRKGNITVNTNDILPIIKKWLYSEHDIFLRELVSNASDAIVKRSVLGRTKNIEVPAPKIEVEIDRPEKVIRVIDNGIGMTEEEVEKYIAKLAFSGAEEFVQKMRSLGADQKEDIIGKFGLGFYSAFMVADKVEIDTLSAEEGAKPCKWISEGNIEYSFEESTRTEIGTTITIHINKDSADFLNKYTTREVLKRYCDFIPHPLFLRDLEEERLKRKEKKEDKKDESEEIVIPDQINNTLPLWKKDPTTLKDEDYQKFYREHFPFDPEPLFWIHLKIDHPFELLGILYFPKLNPNKPVNEQNIRLYAKQVFVSDNVKNIIPEFLSLLKGYIDSPDIPLNVSRSSLQGDPNVKKISNYIVKKVADSLKRLCKSERERYNNIWDDIGLFVKYGCISDEKFDEAMRESVLFKNASGKYVTLGEYVDAIPAAYKDKLNGKILYSERGRGELSLKRQLLNEGIESVETENLIDPHFMQQVEYRKENNPDKKDLKFVAISAEIENILSTENTTDVHIKVKELFKDVLSKIIGKSGQQTKANESSGAGNLNADSGAGAADDSASAGADADAKADSLNNLEVEVKAYKDLGSPAYFKVDEGIKRLQHMTRTMGHMGSMEMPLKKTLVVNPNNPLVQSTLRIWESGQHKELVEHLCQHISDLATLSSEGINTNEEKDKFIMRTQTLMQELTGLIK